MTGRVARRLAFVIVAALAAAAIVEGVIATILALHAPAWLPGGLRAIARDLYMEARTTPQADPALARYDPELVYTLRPGVARFASREFDTELRVNNRGLRDDEASLAAPEVIVVGDSYAMGWGVGEGQTFADLVEGESGLRVLNAAVPSYGTVREMKMLDRLDTSRLRFLVIQYSGNDVDENAEFLESKNRYAGQPPEAYAEFVDGMRQARRYVPGKYVAYALQELAEGVRSRALWWRQNPDAASGVDAGEADAFVNAVAHGTRVDLHPVRLIIFELNPYGGRASELIATLRTRLPAGSLPAYLRAARLIDLYPLLDARHFFSLDDHLNAAGHRIVADAVLAAIRSERP